MNKDVKQLMRSIENVEGVELRQMGNGHVAVYKRERFVTTLPSSPSDSHWRGNTLANLKRGGIVPGAESKGPAKKIEPALSISEIKARLTKMESRQAFARFCVEEMPKLQPEMRTYKNIDSAVASISEMVRREYGLRGWAHVLLDSALRAWEKAPGGDTHQPVAEPEKPVEQLAPVGETPPSEQIVVDETTRELLGDVEPAPVEREIEPEPTMVDLARAYDDLSSRVKQLAERAKKLNDELDALVAERDETGAKILDRVTEGRP